MQETRDISHEGQEGAYGLCYKTWLMELFLADCLYVSKGGCHSGIFIVVSGRRIGPALGESWKQHFRRISHTLFCTFYRLSVLHPSSTISHPFNIHSSIHDLISLDYACPMRLCKHLLYGTFPQAHQPPSQQTRRTYLPEDEPPVAATHAVSTDPVPSTLISPTTANVVISTSTSLTRAQTPIPEEERERRDPKTHHFLLKSQSPTSFRGPNTQRNR